MADSNQLFQAIAAKYRSMDNPDFHWVSEEYERRPYRELERCLGDRFVVEDTTDLNNDVSCVLSVSSEISGARWSLMLSLVGPYAVLLRETGAEGWDVYAGVGSDAKSEEEKWILEACNQHSVEVLSLEVLKIPIPLRLFDAEPENVRMYQALFSDSDHIPGEYDARKKTAVSDDLVNTETSM